MQIGILTYHRSQNYGAQLQAYALQTYLDSICCEVFMVDYWPEYHKDLYRYQSFNKVKLFESKGFSKLTYLVRSAILFLHSWCRHRATNRFVESFFHLSNKPSYDILIYGSDQIWRKQHCEICPSYNPVYFGDSNYQAKYHIAYAASMGKNEATGEDDTYLKGWLAKFTSISVREIDLQDYLVHKLNLSASLVSDPVFLLSKEQWFNILPKKRAHKNAYIFVYNIANCDKINYIARRLSIEKQLPIVEYYGYVNKIRTGNNFDTAGADEFLQQIRDAEYVVTSSFHGVALSLRLEKQFYFATISELANRTVSLLNLMEIEDRDLSHTNDITFEDNIDYCEVSTRVEKYANASRMWLKNTIESIKL